MKSLISGLIDAAIGFFFEQGGTNKPAARTDASPTRRSSHAGPSARPVKRSGDSRSHSAHHRQDPAASKRPDTSIREASIADALAHSSYEPVMDGDADPGEVIWTWVPFQEDASVGKDRPAVVIGAQGEGVYILQLTSKDHTRDADQEAAAGRYWFDIGSGAWDSKGRPSEVRLDRALWVKATEVRREGSILPRATWQRIVDALEDHHRSHGE